LKGLQKSRKMQTNTNAWQQIEVLLMNRGHKSLEKNESVPDSVLAVRSSHSHMSSLTLDDELSTAPVRGSYSSSKGNSALDSPEAPLTKPSRQKSEEELVDLGQDPDLHRIQRFEPSLSPHSRRTTLSSSLPLPMPVRKASVNNMGLVEPMQRGSAKNLRNATFKNISSLPMITDPLVGVKPELAPLISKDLIQTMTPQGVRPQISKEQLACIQNEFGTFGEKYTGSSLSPPLKPKRKASSNELLAVNEDYEASP
jgi:hypothetical protein